MALCSIRDLRALQKRSAWCLLSMQASRQKKTKVTEEQFNPSLSGPSAMSPGQRQKSCSGSARDIGGWTKVKGVKSIQIVRKPEEIYNSGLSATGEDFLSKALPFLYQGNRHPVHIWEKKNMSSNKRLRVAVQVREGEVLQTQHIRDIHMKKCC